MSKRVMTNGELFQRDRQKKETARSYAKLNLTSSECLSGGFYIGKWQPKPKEDDYTGYDPEYYDWN